MHPIFFEQVRLLISVLPIVAKEQCFALKGGTAINLFFRDMPRLSVDIDLAYLPIQNREESLENIDLAFKRIDEHIQKAIPGIQVTQSFLQGSDKCIRLTLRHGNTQVKIEVTPVLRGSVHPATKMRLSPVAAETFGYVTMQLLSFEDLYGGKLCAALDRQHPRDLFDVLLLLKKEGIGTELKNTFLVYLLSHNRPMAEILNPRLKDIKELYEKEFKGMTRNEVTVKQLIEIRDRLINTIYSLLDEKDLEFLHSFKAGEPAWNLFAFPKAAKLPAVRWKLYNIMKMSKRKRKMAQEKLENVLNLIARTNK
jgi:predicted nucleotidyltransferase component of viral defense system